MHEEKKHFSQLKGDFDYNLSLLASRDEELANYERSFAHIKSVINGMVAESSEIKVRGWTTIVSACGMSSGMW